MKASAFVGLSVAALASAALSHSGLPQQGNLQALHMPSPAVDEAVQRLSKLDLSDWLLADESGGGGPCVICA